MDQVSEMLGFGNQEPIRKMSYCKVRKDFLPFFAAPLGKIIKNGYNP